MSLVQEPDYGTPESKSEKMVTLTIDGQKVTAPEGTSIMRAAMEAGIKVPKLCAYDMVESFGSCRVCLVEIEGRAGLPASCTTPVQDGIKVTTQSERLGKIRRNVMELYASDFPADDETPSEMQEMIRLVGLAENRYGRDGVNHLAATLDNSNPYFSFDPSKCIVCSRCVRACDEVQGTFALTVDGRGFASMISAGQDGDNFLSSDCVQACPTATLREKSVKAIGLPERAVVTTCAYCGVGCTFRAEMRGEQLV